MAFTRLLRTLCRVEGFGKRVVPIVPDEARTFGMDALFKELHIYASQGQKYEPVDHDLLLSYSESTSRASSWRRASPRPAAWPSFTAAGTRVRPPRRAHGAVLHLLLDVRLPARRRPHLGGRRLGGPGLPAGRHRRAHHPDRRGTAAPGRAQPAARLDGADLPGLRPRLRLRDGHDHRRRAAAHVRRPGARGHAGRRHRREHLLLPHPLQRELRDAGPARRRDRRGHHRRACTAGPGRPRDRRPAAPRSCSRVRPRVRPAGRRPTWPSTTASAPSCGAPRRTSACARRR